MASSEEPAIQKLQVLVPAVGRVNKDIALYFDDIAKSLTKEPDKVLEASNHRRWADDIETTKKAIKQLKKKQKEFIGSINILIEKVGDLLDEDFLEEANKNISWASALMKQNAPEKVEEKMEEEIVLGFIKNEPIDYSASNWSVDEVINWFASENVNCEEKIREINLTGEKLCEINNKSFLKELGINSLNERSRIWKLMFELKGVLHTGRILGITYFENTILTWASDKSVRVWNLGENNQLNSTLKLQLDYDISCVAFNGRVVAVAKSEEPLITLWDVTGGELSTLNHHEEVITSMQFHENGLLLSTSSSGEIRVADIQTLETKYLKGHRAKVNNAKFNPNTNVENMEIISGSMDKFKQLRFWKLETCKTTTKKKTKFGFIFDLCVNSSNICTVERRGVSVYDYSGSLVACAELEETDNGCCFMSENLIIVGTSNKAIIYHLQGEVLEVMKEIEFENKINGVHLIQDFAIVSSTDFSVKKIQLAEN